MVLDRRTLFRVMLGALGLAALAAVMAMLVPSTSMAWRIAGSATIAAIACGVMMPMAAMADRANTRVAGVAGMGLCVVEFLLGTALVWSDTLGSRYSDVIGLSTVIFALCGLPAIWFLAQIRIVGWRLTAISGAVGLAITAGVFLAAVAQEFFNFLGISDELIGTAFVTGLAAMIVSVCLIGVEQSGRQWRWVGVLAAVAGWCMSLWGIWNHLHGQPSWVVLADAVGMVVAHAILVGQVQLIGAQRWVRVVAIVSAVATAIVLVVVAFDPAGFSDFDVGERVALAMGIIASSATMALAVFARMNKKAEVELTPVTSITSVMVYCPRCERKQTLPVGGAMCSGCKLHIKIEVQAARCATCGYDLSNLESNVCPECGTALPVSPRAVAGAVG